MKLKIVFTIGLFYICGISFAQDYKNNIKSLKEVDIKIEQGLYSIDDSISADKLIIQSSEQWSLTGQKANSNKEWVDIKKQILNTKKRVLQNNEIFASKVIDTVFVTIPNHPSGESQLSGW